MDVVDLFYEDPPILLKPLQDIIGAYVIDIFDSFFMHESTHKILKAKDCRNCFMIRPSTVTDRFLDLRDRVYLSRAFINLFIPNLLKKNQVSKLTKSLSAFVKKVYKGPTYTVKLKRGQKVILTIPFYDAFIQAYARKYIEFHETFCRDDIYKLHNMREVFFMKKDDSWCSF